MKAWFFFDVTDYFNFTFRVRTFANNVHEGREKVLAAILYEPKEIKYVGCSVYDQRLKGMRL